MSDRHYPDRSAYDAEIVERLARLLATDYRRRGAADENLKNGNARPGGNTEAGAVSGGRPEGSNECGSITHHGATLSRRASRRT
jgi:hypothetical protein